MTTLSHVDDDATWIPRNEAPAVISSMTGLKISKRTLARLAVSGGGPEYSIFGRSAYYQRGTLRAWVSQRLGTPRKNTSGSQ